MERKLYSLRGGFKKARKKKGITQSELAETMGVTLKTVMNWEQGVANPDFETVIKLATVLDCDLDYLTGRLEEPTHDIAFIHKTTGISTAAIMKLLSTKNGGMERIILSKIIEHDDYAYIMDRISCLISGNVDEMVRRYTRLKELSEGEKDSCYLKFTMAEDFMPLIADALNIEDTKSVKAIIRYQISEKLNEMINDIFLGKVGGKYD